MISSEKNPKLQLVRALSERAKDRKKQQAFVAEGVRLTEEVLHSGWDVEFVLISENLSERGQLIAAQFAEQNMLVEEIPSSFMQKLADTETPQGILAVVKQPSVNPPQSLDFALICDAIRDPGNLCTILRTADAANVQAVFLAPGTTDPWAPKVLRAGMGAHFHIPLYKLSWEEIENTLKRQPQAITTYYAAADAENTLWEADQTQATALLVGNEAFGPSKEGIAFANQGISIPMPGKSESLNAGMAAGILLYEVVRQRNR